MRKLFLLTLVSFGFLYPKAQEKVFECDLTSDIRISPKAFFIPGEKNSFYLTLANKKYIKRFEVFGNGSFSKLFSDSETDKDVFDLYKQNNERIHRLYDNFSYITGFKGKQKIIDVLFQNFSSDYIFLETDLITGSCVVADTIKRSSYEKYVYSFFKSDIAYLITHLKKKDKLIVYKKKFGESIISDTIPIASGAGSEKSGIKDIVKDDDVLVSYHNVWLPINSLSYRHRAYLNDDILSITYNSEDASTWLVTLNLSNLTSTIKQYPAFTELSSIQRNDSYNSLLIDSLLICTYVTPEALHTKLYNVNSDVLIKKDSISKTLFESLGNPTITKAGNFWSKSNLSEIDFNEFLKVAAENRIRISGYKKSNSVNLTFGTKYNRMPTSTLLANIVSLGMFSFSEVKTPPVVQFDISYSLPDGKTENQKMENMVWDKMIMFVWGKRSFLTSLSFFYQKGFYYIGYYDNIARKYFIHRFKETVQ